MDPVNQGPNINTAPEEFHFSQDPTGRVYFTSSRPGGYGPTDLWEAMQLGPEYVGRGEKPRAASQHGGR